MTEPSAVPGAEATLLRRARAAGVAADLRRLGLVVTPLAVVRVLALLVFVGGPILTRDGPRRPRQVPGLLGGVPALVAPGAHAAGAGLLLAGGIVCLRRRPAGRVVVGWGAGLLLAAAAWAAAMELHFLWTHSAGSSWAPAMIDIVERNAWAAAFPALLLLVCRR